MYLHTGIPCSGIARKRIDKGGLESVLVTFMLLVDVGTIVEQGGRMQTPPTQNRSSARIKKSLSSSSSPRTTSKTTPLLSGSKPKAASSANAKVTGEPAENSKTKLLRAALSEFSDHGFHGTTTKMISKAAGVNEALIIRHFTNKEGLFLKVIEQNYVRDFGELTYPHQKTLLAELLKFSEQVMDTQLRNITFARMFFAHALQNPDFAESMRSGLEGVCAPLLRERFKALVKQGQLKPSTDFEFLEDMIFRLSFSATFFSALLGFVDVETAREQARKEVRLIAKALSPE